MKRGYVPMRHDFDSTDEAQEMARILRADGESFDTAECRVESKCRKLWSWIDLTREDGTIPGDPAYIFEKIDTKVVCPGFAAALEKVGWLRVTDAGVEFPNLIGEDNWIESTARRRAKDRDRKREERAKAKRAKEDAERGTPGGSGADVHADIEADIQDPPTRGGARAGPGLGSSTTASEEAETPEEADEQWRCDDASRDPEPVSLAFEEFWSAYPRRNGKRVGKKQTHEKWRRMSPTDRAAALRGLDAYAARAGEYPRDPVRYLTHELWLDDEDPDEPAQLPATLDEPDPPWLGEMLSAYESLVGSAQAIRTKLLEHCAPLVDQHGESPVQRAWTLYCREERQRNPREIRPHTFAANFVLIESGAYWKHKASDYETVEEHNRVSRIESARLLKERDEMRKAGLDPLNVNHVETWRAKNRQVAEVVS